MSIKETFTDLLNAHDWYYEYSDDNRVYLKGLGEKNEIMALTKMYSFLIPVLADYENTRQKA